ncbi:Protein JSN1 [Nakaseomyces bracarensis]|uniref:Protein JSN1 n=1 Tax=Nakaseomyces bracarensis TaxID=273131 RepID=A0ABR4P0A1_9SACH
MNEDRYEYFPSVISPGVTIPIYEDDDMMDEDDGKRISSYRSKKERFSNTLNSILPSISAKFHTRKSSSNVSNESSSGSTVVTNTNTGSNTTSPHMFSSVNHNNNNNSSSNSNSNSLYFRQQYNGTNNINNNNNNNNNPNFDVISSSSKDFQGTPLTYGSIDNSPNYLSTSNHGTSIPLISPIVPQQMTNNSNNIWYNNNSNNSTNNNNNTNPTPTSIPPSVKDPFEYSNPPISGLNHLQTGNNNSYNNNTTDNFSINRQRTQSGSSYNNPMIGNIPHYGSDMSLHYSLNNATSTTLNGINGNGNTPIVMDDIDPQNITWVTTNPNVPIPNQASTLLPTNTICITNVFPLQPPSVDYNNNPVSHPINLTSTLLASLCSQFGRVISAKTLKHLNIALVEFETIEGAISAIENLQGKEFSVLGLPSTVTLAKVFASNETAELAHEQQIQQQQLDPTVRKPLLHELFLNNNLYQSQSQSQSQQYLQIQQGVTGQPNLQPPVILTHQSKENSATKTNLSSIHLSAADSDPCPFTLPPLRLPEQEDRFRDIVKKFNTQYDDEILNHTIKNALNCTMNCDTNNFGPIPQQSVHRVFDAPKLRELRKAFDSNSLSSIEIEQLAVAMLDELPELCLDYSGNTIIQKMYENCSDVIIDLMLRESHKYLTSMGIHKNGTWVSQKIIKVVHTPRQMNFITKGIQEYCTALFNDQYGNYVIQGVLTFGFPWNSFIFENIMSNFWTIVDNKFGVRAVRACLESNQYMSTEQALLLCSMIILYAEYLSTSSNGTLLVTWYLDSCVLIEKYSMIINSLIPHIAKLCCHKLGSLTILKLLNLRTDSNLKDSLLTSIFGDLNDNKPSDNLVEILKDSNCGGSCLYKIISSRLIDNERKNNIVEKIRIVLLNSNLAHQNKRLIEEVGLTSTNNVNINGSSATQTRHRKTMSHSYVHDNVRQARGFSLPSRSSHPKSANAASSYLSPNSGNGINHMDPISPDPMLYINNNSPNAPIGLSQNPYQPVNETFDLTSQFEIMSLQNPMQNYRGTGHEILSQTLMDDRSSNLSFGYR